MARPLSPSSSAITVAADEHAPRYARQFVRESPAICTDSARDAAVLMVSELVTNAVLHGRPPIVVMIERDQSDVQVTVADHHPHWPSLQNPSPDAVGGRGLRIVDALASAWGIQPRAVGKAVWFVVTDNEPCSPDEPTASHIKRER